MLKALAVSRPEGAYVRLGDKLIRCWDVGNEQAAIAIAEAINDALAAAHMEGRQAERRAWVRLGRDPGTT